VARLAAEKKRVVGVLSAQPLFVMVYRIGNTHLVTRRAEFLGAMKWFQECLLVHCRFGFDELIVDPLQKYIFAGGEWVMHRLVDRVVGVELKPGDACTRLADPDLY